MPPVISTPGTTVVSSPVMARGASFSWGMAFLMVFVLVVVGRIQESIPALAWMRIGLITGGLAGLAWLFAPGSLQDKIPLHIKQVRHVLTLFGLAVITIPFAVWPGHSFEVLTGWYWKIVLLFLMILYWCRSIYDVRRMVWICCLGVVGLVVFGFSTGQLGDERFYADSKSYDPNDLALVLVMVLPLLLHQFSVSGSGYRVILSGMTIVCLYGVVLTQSRGGFLALLTVSVLMLIRISMSRLSKLSIVGISILVFGAFTSPAYWDRIGTMWSPETEYDRTAGGRTEIWKTGLILMATHPWGVGIDGFTTAEGLSTGGEGKWSAAHNSFLQVGVELGVAGLVVFVLLLGRTFKELRRIQTQGTSPNHLPTASLSSFYWKGRGATLSQGEVVHLASALEISIGGYLVGGFFLSQAYNTLLYILLALSLACSRFASSYQEQPEPQSFSQLPVSTDVTPDGKD